MRYLQVDLYDPHNIKVKRIFARGLDASRNSTILIEETKQGYDTLYFLPEKISFIQLLEGVIKIHYEGGHSMEIRRKDRIHFRYS